MSKFYITGIAGTGKSTLAQELNKRGILSLDIDSVPGLCHWKNKVTGEKGEYKSGIGKDWIEAHNWICDVVKLQELLDEYSDTIVIVGIASNRSESLFQINAELAAHGVSPDKPGRLCRNLQYESFSRGRRGGIG